MDQAQEQSNFETTEDLADALEDYLEPEVSDDEEAEDLDGNDPESDEEEELGEASDEDEQEDDDTEEEGEEEIYTIHVNGEDVEVSRDELLNGYQRQADYTRKTQELSQQRKQAETDFTERQQALEAQAQQMNVLSQQLEQMVSADQNINWDQLMDEDPAAYIRLKENVTQRQQALAQAQQQNQYLQQQQQQQQSQKQAEFVQIEQQKLLQEWPEWNDPAKASQGKQAISTYLTNSGFTTEEVSQLADFRTLKLIEKARKYDALQDGKPAIKKRANKAPKVQKPRSARNRKADKSELVQKQSKRLRRTGSINDAASYLENFV